MAGAGGIQYSLGLNVRTSTILSLPRLPASCPLPSASLGGEAFGRFAASPLPLPSVLPSGLPSNIRAPLSALRSGVAGMLPSTKTLNGVLHGVVPLTRCSLGPCVIRGATPSLWFPVAAAMGFQITHAVFPPSPFTSVMQSLYPSVRFLSPARGGRTDGTPQVVFSDIASLPPFRTGYWRTQRCPHLYYSPSREWSEPLHPLPGWILLAHSFDHPLLGGATNATF